MKNNNLVLWLGQESTNLEEELGGKNASLAKMIQNLSSYNIKVPDGFATTATAYRKFISENELEDTLSDILSSYRNGKLTLGNTGKKIRKKIQKGKFSSELKSEILSAYRELKKQSSGTKFSVAVRSSATAEDLPGASFAGQLESFLNIGTESRLLESIKDCYAKLVMHKFILSTIR